MSENTRNTESCDELTVDDLAEVKVTAGLSLALLPAVVSIFGSLLKPHLHRGAGGASWRRRSVDRRCARGTARRGAVSLP